MDTTPEYPAEQISNVSPQESTSTASTTSNISSSISQITGSSVGEVKKKVNAMYAYTSEPAQNVWEQVRSAATGAKAANNTDQGTSLSLYFVVYPNLGSQSYCAAISRSG